MRKQVGVIVAAFFYYSGLEGLARWWMQRRGQTLIILNYHRANGGDLAVIFSTCAVIIV